MSRPLSHLAETTLGVNPVRVLLAVGADVPLPLADEARGVGEAPVPLLGLWTHPQRMIGGAAVEADARGRLIDEKPRSIPRQKRGEQQDNHSTRKISVDR